jgi:hypothetical protein
MQQEFAAMPTPPNLQILGINQVGQESGNALACEGRDLPWLQETLTEGVWIPWDANWRDVVILDRANRKVAVFNLFDHNLANAADYDALRTMLLEAAQ